jgi:hypothetical protein
MPSGKYTLPSEWLSHLQPLHLLHTLYHLLWPCDKPVYIPRHFSNHFLEKGLCEKTSKKIKSHPKSHIYRPDRTWAAQWLMPTCFHYISCILQSLGMCLKLLQEVAISFQMPVCPSFYPRGTTQLPLSRFLWNFVLGIFNKICQPNSSLMQIGQDPCEFMLIYICERSTWTTMYCHLRDKYSTAWDLLHIELKSGLFHYSDYGSTITFLLI